MKTRRNNKKRIPILILSVMTAAAMTAAVAFAVFSPSERLSVKAADPAQTYNIRSAADLIAYSQSYAAGGKNPLDVLNISINMGSVVSDDGFISIGTSDRAFAGTLNLPNAGVDTFHLFDCPLFDYVSTDMKMTGSGTVKIIRERANEEPADGVFTEGSLFANHVVKGSAAANWQINLAPYSGEGNESSSFKSVIGEIAADAEVSISFTNTASIPVVSDGNAGLICGTLNAGATLKVTTAGSGGAVSVTASGHAGGLVGEMKAGAKLEYDSANNTKVNSVTSSAGYAGGIVGKVNEVTSDGDFTFKSGVTDYTVSGTITGSTGAGALFGYYKNNYSPSTFTLADTYAIASGTIVSSSGSSGGVFGQLENNGANFIFNGNGSGGETFSVSISGGSSRGGLAGAFKTSALTSTFTVRDFKPTISTSILSGSSYSGGIIGKITSDNAAYIVIDGETDSLPIVVTVSGSANAGLIGDLGSKGSFADVKGQIKINGNCSASLIANAPQGVVRIKGVTDLSSYVANTDTVSGTFIKSRSRALVYALGSGSDAGWTVKRNLVNACDDIVGWGEVVRTGASGFTESDLFTVDGSAHTVTLKESSTSMGTPAAFAKTALNIALNNSATAVGALRFDDALNSSATLLAADLSLSNDISLVGTGITGLTRDNGDSAQTFTGTFNGNSHTLTFATGESYGLKGDGTALDSDSKQGNIYTHLYNGLFAKISGASANKGKVYDLTLDGDFYINQTAGDLSVGGMTALAGGYTTALNVDSDIAVRFKCGLNSGVSYVGFVGGAIGKVLEGATVSITSGTNGIKPAVSDISAIADNDNTTYVGGVIGYVAPSASNQKITFEEDSIIGLDYSKTTKNARTSVFGAAIAGVGNSSYVKDLRQITFEDNVSVDITANGASASGKNFGAILGCNWYAADVTIKDLTVDADITANANSDFGGLVRNATGRWDIQSISLSSADFTLPGGTFGFVANRSYVTSPDSALYLDIDNTDSNYDIAALTFTGSPSFSRFDEIVSDSRFNGTSGNIANNGNSIISITTSDNVIKTNGSYNTYLNKTTYGQTASGKINPCTRYYYNVKYARANTATAKYNFFVWSLKAYAHSSLAAWFPSTSTFTGDLDMTGISYYPVDLTSSVTFNNATVKLDNVTMEANVKYAYSGEAGTRTTRSNTNQHYLMHTAIFRNATGSISVTGTSDGLKLQGNVPKISDGFCGFLVAGTLGGAEKANSFSASKIVFDGAHITTSSGGDITDTAYAPLLINKIGKNHTLEISAAAQSTTAYSGYSSASKYAASSLIGDVGGSTARTIYLTFGGLKFDGRSSATSIGNMDTTYGTSRSIFSRATILNSFMYAGESRGSYNYEIQEDWGTGTAVHNVTYGKEITDSVEFVDSEKKYYSSEYYTHPTTYQSASEYSFSSGFRPYVYVAYNLGENKHELSINVTLSSTIEGCGKYGDPFIIDDNNKLSIISQIIAGTDVGNTVKIYLPSDLTSYNYTKTDYTKYLYNFDTTTFTSSNGGANQTNVNVRRYLAGAYYVITKDITLPATGSYAYIGLGTADSAEYAFRGVIIGRGDPTITNESKYPLIYTSMGSVVKGLTVDVDINETFYGSNVISLAAPLGSGTYAYSGGNETYGAVIGQILGGDTIIDSVNVTFTDASFNITEASASNYKRLVPIGGYVGTIVNGGLIFRNMSDEYVGLTDSVFDKVEDDGYLYVNPIIGRVIAGYAFHEADDYSAVSAYVDNGDKNYTIADLSLSESKLNVVYTSSDVFTITVPNGQALFILSAIINSGAGSAARNASTEQAYNALTAFWQAYREHTTVRGGAEYTGVGTASGDDYTAACNDSYTNGRVKTPYIIQAYTNKSGSVYPARCISTYTSNVINVTGDCVVPAGYRGIGSIYYDNNYVRLRIKSMNGRNSSNTSNEKRAITLAMRYLEYNHKFVTQYIAYAPVTTTSGNPVPTTMAGFGLFNRLNITSASSSNCVQNLELSGSVFYDVYAVATGAQANYSYANFKDNDRSELKDLTDATNTEDTTMRRTILSVGGLAGIVNDKCYIKNVTFNDLYVEGAKNAGGLIGFLYTNTQTDNRRCNIAYESGVENGGFVNVVGGQCVGGLIGKIFRSAAQIDGASGGTDIVIKNIESKNTDPNETNLVYFANLNSGVGGIIGNCWGSDKTGYSYPPSVTASISNKQQNELFINNINVTKGSSAANVRVLNDRSGNNDGRYNYAGGFVGSAHYVYLKITYSNLKCVSVTANTAGGIVGKLTQHFYLEVFNCSANGCATGSGTTKDASVSGTRYAGGVVGWAIGRDKIYFQLRDFTVKNYNIESVSTKNSVMAGAGGILGYAEGNNIAVSGAANVICQFNNLTVLNCNVTTNYTDPSTDKLKYKVGTGGIIGVIDTINSSDGIGNPEDKGRSSNTNNKYKFSGYNILVKDCTLTHLDGGSTNKSTSANNQRIGDIVGNNAVSTTIKFVGVSVDNTGYYVDATTNAVCGKHVGMYNSNVNNYGSDGTFGTGYVVFANFNAEDGNEAFSTIDDTSTAADDYTNVDAAYPFVTTNPAITTGGIKLVGDGVAGSVANLPINDILADITANGTTAVYAYAGNAYYSGSSGQTNAAAFTSYLSKLSMFKSEATDYLGTDFPILVLEDTNRDNSHKMINSYLRLLTNTTHDFGTDKSGEFSVQIYKVSYEEGSFKVKSTGASLKRDDGKFYMRNTAFDSGKIQFSLIDVRFYDPASTTNTAYHLYVPVFVKKVLSFEFDIAALSGTNYLKSLYTSRFGQMLIENVGTPVTLFFRYTYSRTALEWQNAINSGENVNRNYSKNLMFYKANTNDILDDFPSDTVLVLVDPNKGGKEYYSTFGNAVSGNTLDLSKFKSVMNYSEGVYTFSGESFAPEKFEDLMTATVSTDASGSLVVAGSVTVKEGSAYRLATLEDGDAQRYSFDGDSAVEDDGGSYVNCDAETVVIYNNVAYRLATDEELADGGVQKYSATVTLSDTNIVENYYLSIFTESNALYDELFHYYLITSPSSFGEIDYPSKIADTDPHTMVHVMMGKIFDHELTDISSESLEQTQVMTADNNILNVTISAEMGVSDDLDDLKSEVMDLVGGTEVYQSFIIYLNRTEGESTVKAILGDPDGSGSYTISGTVGSTNYSVIRITQNYAEFVSGDLSGVFSTRNELFTVEADVSLEYAAEAITTQFPGRSDAVPNNGVTVSGSSNIAFSQTETTFSKNSHSGDETPVASYYSEADPEVARLNLNAIGDKLGDFTPLGINALNNDSQSYADFDLLAVIDASAVYEQIEDYVDGVMTITLKQKQADGSYDGDDLTVATYISSFTMDGVDPSDISDNGTNYTVLIDRTLMDDRESEIFLPTLSFRVKTGAAFEALGLVYANYRITVSVVLRDEYGTEYSVSRVSNFVVYTNAKIIPDYIS